MWPECWVVFCGSLGWAKYNLMSKFVEVRLLLYDHNTYIKTKQKLSHMWKDKWIPCHSKCTKPEADYMSKYGHIIVIIITIMIMLMIVLKILMIILI